MLSYQVYHKDMIFEGSSAAIVLGDGGEYYIFYSDEELDFFILDFLD